MKNKKIIFGIFIFVISLILCGCSNTELLDNTNNILDNNVQNENIDESKNSQDVKIEETEDEFTMTKVICLKENPTTGFTWSYEILDESIATVESDEYTADEVADGIVGSGGVHAFKVSGLKEGQTTIKFIYSRPWESFQPLQTEVFTLVVNSNNMISVIKN